LDKQIVRLGRSGKTDDALALYHSVEKPSVRLMNSAIDACSRAHPTRLKQAFEIFEAGVHDENLLPNVFSFGALMNACNRARNSSQALALLRSMQVRSFLFCKYLSVNLSFSHAFVITPSMAGKI
jgi:pentatricopeptide repeat protein